MPQQQSSPINSSTNLNAASNVPPDVDSMSSDEQEVYGQLQTELHDLMSMLQNTEKINSNRVKNALKKIGQLETSYQIKNGSIDQQSFAEAHCDLIKCQDEIESFKNYLGLSNNTLNQSEHFQQTQKAANEIQEDPKQMDLLRKMISEQKLDIQRLKQAVNYSSQPTNESASQMPNSHQSRPLHRSHPTATAHPIDQHPHHYHTRHNQHNQSTAQNQQRQQQAQHNQYHHYSHHPLHHQLPPRPQSEPSSARDAPIIYNLPGGEFLSQTDLTTATSANNNNSQPFIVFPGKLAQPIDYLHQQHQQSAPPYRRSLKMIGPMTSNGTTTPPPASAFVAADSTSNGLYCNVPEHHRLEDYLQSLQDKYQHVKKRFSDNFKFKLGKYSENLNRLKEKIEEKKEELQEIDLNLMSKKSEADRLDQTCMQLNQERITLANQNKALMSQTEQLIEDRHIEEDLNVESDALKRKQAGLIAEVRGLEQTLLKKQSDLQLAETKLKQTEAEHRKVQFETKDVIEKFEQSKIWQEKLTLECEEIEKRAKEASLELARTYNETETAHLEINKLEQQEQDLKSMLHSIEQLIAEKDAQFQSIEQKSAEANQRLRNVQQNLELTADQEREKLCLINEGDQALNEARLEMKSLQQEIETEKKQVNALSVQIGQKKAELQLTEKELERLKLTAEKLNREHEKTVQENQREGLQLEQQLRHLEQERDKTAKHLEEMRAEMDQLNSTISSDQQTIKSQQNLVTKLQDDTKRLMQQKEASQSELTHATSEHKLKLENLECLKQALLDEKSDLERVEMECKKLANELEMNRHQMSREQSDVERLSRERIALENEVQLLQKQKTVLEEQCAASEFSLANTNRKIESNEANMNQAAQRLSHVQSEHSQLAEKCQTDRRELTQLNYQSDQLKKQIDQLNNQIEALNAKIGEQKSISESTNQQTEQRLRQFNEMSGECQRLENRTNTSKSNLMEASRMELEMRANLEQLEQQIGQRRAALHRVEQQVGEAERQLEKARARHTHAQAQHEEGEAAAEEEEEEGVSANHSKVQFGNVSKHDRVFSLANKEEEEVKTAAIFSATSSSLANHINLLRDHSLANQISSGAPTSLTEREGKHERERERQGELREQLREAEKERERERAEMDQQMRRIRRQLTKEISKKETQLEQERARSRQLQLELDRVRQELLLLNSKMMLRESASGMMNSQSTAIETGEHTNTHQHTSVGVVGERVNGGSQCGAVDSILCEHKRHLETQLELLRDAFATKLQEQQQLANKSGGQSDALTRNCANDASEHQPAPPPLSASSSPQMTSQLTSQHPLASSSSLQQHLLDNDAILRPAATTSGTSTQPLVLTRQEQSIRKNFQTQLEQERDQLEANLRLSGARFSSLQTRIQSSLLAAPTLHHHQQASALRNTSIRDRNGPINTAAPSPYIKSSLNDLRSLTLADQHPMGSASANRQTAVL